MRGFAHSPRRPIVRVCIIHIGDRIKIQGPMSLQEILAMLLGEIRDPVLDIEGLLLASLHGRRGRGGPLDMGPLDMEGIAISLLHGVDEMVTSKITRASVGGKKEPVQMLLISPVRRCNQTRVGVPKPEATPRTFKSLGVGAKVENRRPGHNQHI